MSLAPVELRAFVAVADAGSFTRAAAELGYSPSNLSQQVRKLERELGVALFARTSRSVRLTAQGADLLSPAREVLAAVERLRQRATTARHADQGRFTLAYGPFTGSELTTVVDQLRRQVPGMTVVTRAVASSRDVLRAVRSGKADAGIAKWSARDLSSLALTPAHGVALLVPETHRLHGRSAATVFDLNEERLLAAERQLHPEFHDRLLAFFASHDVRPVLRYGTVTSSDQVHDFVRTGQGVSFCFPSGPPPEGTSYVALTGPLPPIDQVNLVWAHRGSRVDRLLEACSLTGVTGPVCAVRPAARPP
ncbi:MAG: LysR family transcriptional regulator [Frankiales bacterium]|nr:LysR family transcriptional regulator [Frankiales bacterium]